MTGTEKKTKAPTPFRIEQETADRFREAAKEFSNQDAALNALLAAFEREKIQESNPQFSEVMNEFEKYQRCLSAKFADVLKALATAAPSYIFLHSFPTQITTSMSFSAAYAPTSL